LFNEDRTSDNFETTLLDEAWLLTEDRVSEDLAKLLVLATFDDEA